MSNHPVVEYSENALSNPMCPQCGERATARMGEREGRAVAEFWDSNAHVWFVRLPSPAPADNTPTMTPRMAAAELARIAHYLISPDGFTKRDAAQQLAQIARKLNRGAVVPFSEADMQQLLGRAKDLTPRKFVLVIGTDATSLPLPDESAVGETEPASDAHTDVISPPLSDPTP